MSEAGEERFCLKEEYDLLDRVLQSGEKLEEETHVGGSQVATKITLSREALFRFRNNPTQFNLDAVRNGYLADGMTRSAEKAIKQFEAGCFITCDKIDDCCFLISNSAKRASNSGS